jgi:phosphoenolpyruvate carboxykinase (GTP)
VFRRCDGDAEAVDTPIGRLPAEGSLETDGLGLAADDLAALLEVDVEGWKAQLPQIHGHFARFDRLPGALRTQLEALEQRLS